MTEKLTSDFSEIEDTDQDMGESLTQGLDEGGTSASEENTQNDGEASTAVDDNNVGESTEAPSIKTNSVEIQQESAAKDRIIVSEVAVEEEEFLDKLKNGNAPISLCNKWMKTLLAKEYLRVKGYSRDLHSKGAEGAVEQQSFDMFLIIRGNIIAPPISENSTTIVQFTDKYGSDYTAYVDSVLGKNLFKSLYAEFS